MLSSYSLYFSSVSSVRMHFCHCPLSIRCLLCPSELLEWPVSGAAVGTQLITLLPYSFTTLILLSHSIHKSTLSIIKTKADNKQPPSKTHSSPRRLGKYLKLFHFELKIDTSRPHVEWFHDLTHIPMLDIPPDRTIDTSYMFDMAQTCSSISFFFQSDPSL